MNNNSEKTLILSLADILSGNQVDAKAVSEALERICSDFSYDCGFVYDRDQFNYLNLKERYTSCEIVLCECFDINEIRSEYRGHLARETISFINKSIDNSPGELELLNIFGVVSLAVVSVVDENFHILGLLIFMNTSSKEVQVSKHQNTLPALLSMLARYVGIRMYQNKIFFLQRSLESILDNAGIDIYVNDFYNHDILYVNKSMAAPYGGVSRFLGNKCWEVLFPGQNGPCDFCPQKELIDEEGKPTKVYSWDYQRPFDGSWFRVFSAAFRWVDGRLAHVVSSADITENKKNEELIQYMAHYDSLTKLPNRRMLISECERRINHSQEGEKGFLLFFDIDGFKAINDNFGHDAGDEFLVKLGEFFSDIPMLKNAIYRNGGDEFIAILDGITEANIRNLAGFIHQRFQKPWVLKNGTVYCNTSIGVACYPRDGLTVEKLLYIADQAMYQVKKSGGGGICFGYELE